jgi:amino acid adenylation domain-containing protein
MNLQPGLTEPTDHDSQGWLPLGDAQRAVWLDLRLGANPLAYLLGGRARIDGTLDLEALRQSLSALLARHDALRLRVDPEQPRQRLAAPGGALPLQVHALPADSSDEATEAALEAWIAERLAAPLPLGDAPLFFVDLVQVRPGRSELLWRFNHLIADSAALAITLRRWGQTYELLSGDIASELPPGSSFVATLAADAAYAASPQAAADLAHWERRFDELPAALLEHAPRGASQPASVPSQPQAWSLDGPAYAAWRSACSQAGVPEQRALVALWALALGTRFDRRDLCIGLALHRRDRSTREVIGMLAAAVPVRCQWSADATLRQAVRGMAEQIDLDFRHQRAPIDAIGRALGLGARGQGPLFDASLSLTVQEPTPAPGPATGHTRITAQALVPAAIVPLPLLVSDHPAAQKLAFVLACDPARVDAAQAAAVARALRDLITLFCRQPTLAVAAIEPATDAERAQLLACNPPPVVFAPDALLHDLVRAQAAATPQAVAVIDGDRVLDYAALEAHSNTLAAHIRQAVGTRPNVHAEPVVAVALPRSAETVVALLAILKAGAVYLPLDIAHPTARLQWMLDDAGACLLIDDGSPAAAELRAPRLPPASDAFSAVPMVSNPSRLAYVIYTSGSTGQPKAVGVSHRAAVNLSFARQAHDPIGPGDRVLAAISVGFDVSIGQLLLPLLRGAAIVIAPPLRNLQADAFWALLARHGVSHINSVPSFFDTVSEALVALPQEQRYRGLKRLMLGGEPLTGALARKLQQRLPGTQIVNMYGPTEACIDATAYVVPAEGALPAALPIGRPLANLRAYVLDGLGRLVPPGVTGELCLAGAGLARGYLGQPAATAEKFVADPFGEPGERMYRTGDQARWAIDEQGKGLLEFLGRSDEQVKIRGFRVETGEVQAVLLQHAGVQQAAVIAVKQASASGVSHTRLVAYLVSNGLADGDQASPDNDALKAWLATRLPEHMLPGTIVWLPALPLTANGKLDRKALPAPDTSVDLHAYAEPQGEAETQLAALWRALLQRQQAIGRAAHFFEIGGHSLLAIALVDRLRREGWQLDVRQVFEQPTLQAMAAAMRRDGAQPAAEMSASAAITSAQRVGPLPLSLAQERLWVLMQLDPQASLAYHLPGGVRLQGALDSAALEAALRRIVQRHEVLRTRFEPTASGAVLHIDPSADAFVLQQADLRSHHAPEDAALALAHADASTPFDLQQGPPLRAHLLRLADDTHWLLVTLHHIVGDGWSMGVLVAEFAALYTAFSRGQPDPLPPLALQFADHALWERQPAQAAARAQSLPFWTQHLAGAPALLELPTDRARPAVQSHAGGSLRFALDASLSAGLAALSLRHGTTLFMTLLASWAALLARLSGQDDIVIGVPVANRQRSELAPLIGFFVNTLALRLDLSAAVLDAPGAAALLQQVRQRWLDAQEHAELPFAQVVQAVAPQRSRAHSPLFQVMFGWLQTPPAAPQLPDLVLQPLDLSRSDQDSGRDSHSAKVDLALDLEPAGDCIAGTLTYASALFDRATAERQVASWQRLLQGMVDAARSPDLANVSLARIPLLSANERQPLLFGWNATQRPYPRGQTLHGLFEEQVLRSPQAVALVSDDGSAAHSIRYARLNARANQLARHLVALGVQPDDRVAILAERSIDMVLALLATLKAGAAYLPLDPSYPAERLAHMLADAAPRVLLTQSALWIEAQSALLPLTTTGPSVVVLDDADPAFGQLSPLNLQPAALGLHERHLAYVIYTSGSTGRPKGVMVEHVAIVNRLRWMQEAYALQPGEAVLQKTPYGFDVSVWEFFWPLMTGARLVLARPEGHKDPAYLSTLIQTEQISTLHFVPSMLQVFLQHPQAGDCSSLRRIVCSGEALPAALAERCLALLPWAQLHNLYGPTEAAVDVSAHPVRQGSRTPSGGVPIGSAVANTSLYVLDAWRQPVPVGVAGELYIGGVQVARGYLHQPELTAQRFVPDPFAASTVGAEDDSPRMYQTGDLVRWLPNGEIEYLGRNDHQVKIRGQRIELGEIEAALLAVPGVHEAVVLALDDPADALNRRLVAYITTTQALPDNAALRATLARTLPAHMLPAAVVRLDALPLSANGKLDRKALPAPDASAFGHATHSAPQGGVETVLATIWSDLLQQPQVGRNDNFFALGGHSLLAIVLVQRLRDAGLALELGEVFSQPTLQALAGVCSPLAVDVDPAMDSQGPPPGVPAGANEITPAMLPLVALTQAQIDGIVAAVPGGAPRVQDILPLAPLQHGMLFQHLMQRQGDVFITPFILGFAQRAQLDACMQALQQVLARHDILRTSIAWEGLAEAVQVVWRDATLTLQELPAVNSGDALALLKTYVDPRSQRIDLRQAPLLRAAALHDTADRRWLLALSLHHMVLDHGALALVLREVAALCAGEGQTLPTPQPYRQLLWHARQGLDDPGHTQFFRAMLADLDTPTAPWGLDSLLAEGTPVRQAGLAVAPAVAAGLRQQARGLGVGTASLLHLAWGLVLARTSASHGARGDVVFGTLLSGRMQAAAGDAHTLGMLINTLPLRLRLGGASVLQAVQATHAGLLDLLQHEAVPLAVAQRCSGVAAPAPLFTALLNVRHSGGAVALPGAELLWGEERTGYPLAMAVDDDGVGFHLVAQAAQAVAPEQVLGLMMQALEALLQALQTTPDRLCTSLDLLTDAQRTQLLALNPPPQAFAPAALLHGLVQAQAAATPQAPAVIDGDTLLDYAQLDARSDALAARIRRALGGTAVERVEPVVAVALPRSADTVVALLAILKAGAVYLPLDIAHPLARLQWMLDDAAASLLIDDVHGVTAGLQAPRLAMQGDAGGEPFVSDAFDPEHLAYVIYTSGSTGQPKAVGVSHRAAVNLSFARQAHDPIGPGDRVLAAISVGFDVSIGQLLLPLLRGAAIVIAPPLRNLQADAFWALLARNHVTHINSVPSFFDTVSEALVSLPESQRYRGLKRLMLGGEPLTGALARKLQQRLPGTQIVNMYGPTEACIDATAYVVPAEGALPAALPIGRPLANLRAYVLDAQGLLVPPGVAGELCLAGAGLARGYIGQPEATADKFVADPYGDFGERMYCTGDQARWVIDEHGDGLLEFLGRSDEQVKIRGFRVETGEVQAVLLQHAGVQQAAVVAVKDSSASGVTQTRLVAYLVAGDQATPDKDALKAWLAQRLPEHMLPAAIVWLPALPLTPNGKLDRKALPAPDTASTTSDDAAPQGEVESLIAGIWQEMLGVPRVGRDDDFFDLGGHSLRAIALVERLRQAGLALDVPTLFAQPRLRALAAACKPSADAAGSGTPGLLVPPIGIPADPAQVQQITPAMLPMVALSPSQIDSIVARVPGGAAQVQDIYPLAPLQEGMLFHHLLQTQGDVYLTPMVSAFSSRAALDAFLGHLQQVIDRHDILRSSIAWEGLNEPVQVVWRTATLPVHEAEPVLQGDALAALLAQVDPRQQRIDLQRAPLLRAVVLHDANHAQGQRWLLAILLHHLTLDHSSMDTVVQEVQAMHAGLGALLPPSVPFRNLVWQARNGVSRDEHETFFRSMLADVDTPTTPWGLDQVTGADDGVQEALLPLPAALCLALRQQARAAGVSVASLMHLAWALVLARGSNSGSDDVVFGTVLFGRMQAGAGADRALGMLINTLPLRVDTGKGLDVLGALQATHQRLLQLMRHEHAPLTLAQRCSGVAAPAPLFTALFNFRHDSAPVPMPTPASDMGMALVYAQERTGYPLAIAVDDDGQGLRLTVQATAPAHAPRVAALMHTAVAAIVQALQSQSTAPCASLDLVDDAQRSLLLGLNPPPQQFAPGAALPALVRQQVHATPDALAVLDDSLTLSYAELDRLSDGLAQQIRLALRGCAADEPVVAVALPRSAGTVVALLAVLKARAVYLPLDIEQPTARLQHMLDDAAAVLLIDEGDGPSAALRAPRLRDLGNSAHVSDAAALMLLPQIGSPERLAYMIYTSGSTGQPKAVGVSHRAAVNLSFARQAHDPIGPGDRVLAAISVGFDVSIGQLLLPLLRGAAIVIAPPLRSLQADAFWGLLARHGVTHINSVPSFFDTVSEALVALPQEQRYQGLKRLMLGGEPLTGALARKLQQRLLGTQIVNMYGPTEACIDATAYVVPAEGALPAALPIGRPLANLRAYVLDGLGRLVPPGVTGELCLAGAGLARGYLGQPAATAEKFVADPFGEPGERMYRTGDQARWAIDEQGKGLLEFLGRSDEQVKIRGFRVETGEVQAVLLQHAGVLQAAVIAVKQASTSGVSHTRLVAYLVSHAAANGEQTSSEQANSDGIKVWLAERLPEHMLPAAFVWLPSLPLTANGKLDRKALPAPDDSASRVAQHVAPRDALETQLQAAWQAVFGRSDIGVHDDFFALGGQSLLAIRLVAACAAAAQQAGIADAQQRITLQGLLARPTIAGMAEAVRGSAPAAAQLLVTLREGGDRTPTRTPLFCVHPQSGMVWCYLPLLETLDADVPVYGLHAQGFAPGEAPLPSIDAMATAYVQALRAVQPHGPYQLLGYSSGGVAAQAMALQLQQAGEEVALLALIDSPLPDGSDLREPETADVLVDIGHTLGVTDDSKLPRDAGQLLALLTETGLAAPGFGLADAERGIQTALAIVRATRRHRVQPLQVPLLQVRALQRDTPSPDWRATLASKTAETHDLDCDHLALMTAPWAARVATLLSWRLR